VLAISSIVVVAATGSVATLHESMAVRFDAERLRLMLERGYAYAVSSESPALIELERDRVTLRAGGRVVTTYRTGKRVVIGPPEWLRKPLHFYPTLTTSPATLLVSSTTNRCAVTLSLRGRTRITC